MNNQNQKLQEEIRESIRKNLSSQVGEELVKELDELSRLREENESLKEKLNRCEKNFKDANNDIIALSEELKSHKELNKREDDISKREQSLEVEVLKIKLEESEKRGTTVEGFVNALMRNTIKRKSILDSEDQAGYHDSNGHWIQPTPVNKSLNQEETED